MIPNENAIESRNAFLGSVPASETNPNILSEITGSTHGITFKIKPPIIAKPSICRIPTSPITESPLTGRAAAKGVVSSISYPFRALPEPTTKTPSIRLIGLTSVSIGIVKLLRSRVMCPITASSGGTGKKSRSESSRTPSTTAIRLLPTRLKPILTGSAGWLGTRDAYF